MKKWITMAVLAALTAGCGGEGTADAPGSKSVTNGAGAAVLRWTAIPDTNPEELKAKYNPVSEYLSAQLGVQCKYEPVADYKASVEAFKTGDIQLAWFGGLTGVQARAAVDGATAIAQGVEDPIYKSYFIAHKDTGIEKSAKFPMELGNFAFAFGSASSTSGRLMPEYFIRTETGKAPQDFFSVGFSFSGAHDKTALMVQDGTEVKVGVLSYTTYDTLVAEGKIDPDVCRVVWVTPLYADYNFTAHPSLEKQFGEGFTAKLQQALIDMKDPKLLGAFPRSGLIKASNEDFAKIETVATDLGLLR